MRLEVLLEKERCSHTAKERFKKNVCIGLISIINELEIDDQMDFSNRQESRAIHTSYSDAEEQSSSRTVVYS